MSISLNVVQTWPAPLPPSTAVYLHFPPEGTPIMHEPTGDHKVQMNPSNGNTLLPAVAVAPFESQQEIPIHLKGGWSGDEGSGWAAPKGPVALRWTSRVQRGPVDAPRQHSTATYHLPAGSPRSRRRALWSGGNVFRLKWDEAVIPAHIWIPLKGYMTNTVNPLFSVHKYIII